MLLESFDEIQKHLFYKARMGIIATNIFERQNINKNNNNDEEWLLIHHHGSVVSNYIPPNISD
jgi:hypothetical protein